MVKTIFNPSIQPWIAKRMANKVEANKVMFRIRSWIENLECSPTSPIKKRNNIRTSYILRRYCPPTSNSECVIWPKEQTLVASINSSNIFAFSKAAFWIFFNASDDSFECAWCKSASISIWYSFSSAVARITSPGVTVGEPFLFKRYLHQWSETPHCVLMSHNKETPLEFYFADTWFPSPPIHLLAL